MSRQGKTLTGEGHAEETLSEGRRRGKGSLLYDTGISRINYTKIKVRKRSEANVMWKIERQAGNQRENNQLKRWEQ